MLHLRTNKQCQCVVICNTNHIEEIMSTCKYHTLLQWMSARHTVHVSTSHSACQHVAQYMSARRTVHVSTSHSTCQHVAQCMSVRRSVHVSASYGSNWFIHTYNKIRRHALFIVISANKETLCDATCLMQQP